MDISNFANINNGIMFGNQEGGYTAKLEEREGKVAVATIFIDLTKKGQTVQGEEDGVTFTATFSKMEIRAFKKDRDGDVENAHHRIVGRGTINHDDTDYSVVLFPDRSGKYFGIRPDTSGGTPCVDDFG